MMWSQFKKNGHTWRVEKYALRAIGIDIGAAETGRPMAYPLFFYLTWLTVLLVGSSMAGFVYENYKNVVAATTVLNMMMQCSITLAKTSIFCYNLKEIADLYMEVDKVHELYEKPNPEETKATNDLKKQSQLIAVVYYIVGILSTISYLVPPLLSMLLSAFNGAANYRLPYDGVFPYNYKTPLNYTLTFTTIGFSIYFHIHIVVGMDCLFLWFVFNISAYYRVLRIKLKEIGKGLGDEVGYSATLFRERVVITFSYHRHTMQIIDKFQAVFVQILFLEVLMNCLKICFSTFQFSNTGDMQPSTLVYHMAALLTILLKLIIYSFGGEKIQSESEDYCNAMYMLLPWHAMTPTNKRLFILPLMVAQRPIAISGYFFMADRNLLVWIFKTAGSFSALLNAMKQQD